VAYNAVADKYGSIFIRLVVASKSVTFRENSNV